MAAAVAEYETMSPDQRGAELFKASETGNIEAVNTLLSMETNIEYLDQYTQTPLLIAALNGHTEIVEHLLSAGANKEAADRFGQTSLFNACWKGHIAIVERLLAAGAKIEAANVYKATPLLLASWNNHLAIVERLLSIGANKEAAMADGETSLYKAASNGYTNIVERLLKVGANREVIDKHGQTPLFVATLRGHIDVIRHLLGAGANIGVRNKNGALLMSIIPNAEIKKLFDMNTISHPTNKTKNGFNTYRVGDKITVIVNRPFVGYQNVAATVVDVVQRYRINPIKLHNDYANEDIEELFRFVFPQLFPGEKRIEDLSDANPYKRNPRLIDLLRSLNDPADDYDAKNTKLDELYAMNDPYINIYIDKSRKVMTKDKQGITVEFDYSPGVYGYYKTDTWGKESSLINIPSLESHITPTGIETYPSEYSMEQVMAIEAWVDNNNTLITYLFHPVRVESLITHPLVGSPRMWREAQQILDHEYDLLYSAASPTPVKRVVYRGAHDWPKISVRRRTIFATSIYFEEAKKFGDVAEITIPIGTRILDLSDDFNTEEGELLIFPSVRDANMVVEPINNGKHVKAKIKSKLHDYNHNNNIRKVIIRNVNGLRNAHLSRNRHRSSRKNRQTRRRR
jgi:ankyrin repeat protein